MAARPPARSSAHPPLRAVGPSTRTERAVLKAASELLASRRGAAAVTMEKIAARAKVAKTTLYRWWPSKVALFMDVFEQQATKQLLGIAPSGSVQTDLSRIFRGLFRLFRTTSAGAAVAGMIVEAQVNPKLAPIFRDEFVARGRVLARRALGRASRNREIPTGTDIELAIDVISGAIWYRLLLDHAPLDDAYADGIVDVVLNGIRVRTEAAPAPRSAATAGETP